MFFYFDLPVRFLLIIVFFVIFVSVTIFFFLSNTPRSNILRTIDFWLMTRFDGTVLIEMEISIVWFVSNVCVFFGVLFMWWSGQTRLKFF